MSAATTATNVLRNGWRTHAPMTALAIASSIAVVAILGLLTFDRRELLGVPVWFKPLKFMLSTALYAFTFTWLLSLPWRRRRIVRAAATAAVAFWTIELTLLVTQAVRGVPSHFNQLTDFDRAVFVVMGAAATFLWFANILVAIVVFGDRDLDPVRSWAVRLGLLLTLVGMAVGFLMPMQKDTALPAQLHAGQTAQLIGGHAVGVADGGPGLPLVNWSTEGGDLRVPHFVGLHALQVMPLVALLALRNPRLHTHQRVGLLQVTAAGYAGLLVVLTWQALRAQPLIRPDRLTLAALAAVAATVVVGSWAVLRPGRRPAPA